MDDKTFLRLLVVIAAAGIISMIILLVCTAVMFSDVSVITFIANGRTFR